MLRHVSKVITTWSVVALLSAVSAGYPGQAFSQSADAPPRILIVSESDSRLPLVKRMLQGIEAELGPDFTTRSEIYVEYLDMLRFNDPRELELIRAFLTERYGRLGLDAIGVVGTNALKFMSDNRGSIAPGSPMVFGGVGQEGLSLALSGETVPDVSGVISPFDFRATLDLALQVQPDAPEIVVIAGSAIFDQQWRKSVTDGAGASYGGKPVRLLPEASAEDYLAQARGLDPGTIVLVLSVNLDTEGRRFLPVEFARALAEASAAPVWSVYETQIGSGVAGGAVENLDETGRNIGAILRMAAAGDPLPKPVTMVAGPTVDWRAMKRHGLDFDRLPEGTRILFYEPTLWETYYAQILGIAALVAIQSATIVGLLFHRRRYLSTQASLDLERSQLIHVSRNLRLGQLSASLAHEINQPLAAIQANADAGKRLAKRSPPDLDELAEIFQDISADVQRAGSTIAGLRRLMVKGEVTMERVDLNEVIRATLPLVQNELDASGARVQLALAPGPVEVNGNAAQLQQIVLNLVLNASEAMASQPEGTRMVTVSSGTDVAERASLTVEDAGPGVPPDQREAAFRPFVSSKSSGLGVGLAICRSIAEAHGGTLAFGDPVGGGGRVVLSLPGAAA
jgi:signal transduction histidine kinase